MQRYFFAADDEWVTLVGRYILNMGVVDTATKLVIVSIDGNDKGKILNAELSDRLSYIRWRLPRKDRTRHEASMKALSVAEENIGFRDMLAHSPISITSKPDGTIKVQGIVNVDPSDKSTLYELVSLAKLRAKVDESAMLVGHFLAMQLDGGPNAGG